MACSPCYMCRVSELLYCDSSLSLFCLFASLMESRACNPIIRVCSADIEFWSLGSRHGPDSSIHSGFLVGLCPFFFCGYNIINKCFDETRDWWCLCLNVSGWIIGRWVLEHISIRILKIVLEYWISSLRPSFHYSLRWWFPLEFLLVGGE